MHQQTTFDWPPFVAYDHYQNTCFPLRSLNSVSLRALAPREFAGEPLGRMTLGGDFLFVRRVLVVRTMLW